MGELKSEGKRKRGSFRTCDSRRSVTCKMCVNCTIPHGDTEGVCCEHHMPTQASCEALLPGGEGRTFVPLNNKPWPFGASQLARLHPCIGWLVNWELKWTACYYWMAHVAMARTLNHVLYKSVKGWTLSLTMTRPIRVPLNNRLLQQNSKKKKKNKQTNKPSNSTFQTVCSILDWAGQNFGVSKQSATVKHTRANPRCSLGDFTRLKPA